MKKVMTILGVALFTSMILLGCTQKPENIKLTDLKTACDYIDALEKCGDAIIKLKKLALIRYQEGGNSLEDFSQEINVLQEKIDVIGKAGDKKFTKDEFNECPSFDRIKEKMNKIHQEGPESTPEADEAQEGAVGVDEAAPAAN